MKKYISILLAFVLTFSLSACGKTEEVEEEAKKEPRELVAYDVKKQDFQPIFKLSGNLKTKTEAIISAETSGTVKKLNFKEGDRVKKGDLLLSLDSSDNPARVTLETAQNSLNNAQRLLDFTISSASSSERTAQLAIEQAEISLAVAKKTDLGTDLSNEEQIKSLENAIETAKVNLQIAEKDLADEKVNQEKTRKNLLQNAENAHSVVLIEFRSDLQSVDEILGVTDQNKNLNDSYEGILSIRKPELMPKVKMQFKTAKRELEALESEFAGMGNLEEADSILKDSVTTAKVYRELLKQMDEVLQNTISNGGLSTSSLAGLKSEITVAKSSLEVQMTTLTSISQSISDYLIQSPQIIRARELAVTVAKENLEQAEHNLENTKASLDVSKVSTSSQIEIAQKSLDSAKAQLENTKKQNEIAIQNARSARDSAQKQLDSAQLSYSKLSIESPVSGVIVSKSVDQGDTVNAGAELFSVAEVDYLTLEGDLAPEEAGKIAEGDTANIFIDNQEIEQKGRIKNISPTADPNTRKVKIEIEIENKEKNLFANTFARAEIKAKKAESLLSIPLSALISKNPPTVFVIQDNFVERRIVEIGRRGEGFVEIISGLEEGEAIVAETNLGLENGDEVKISKTVNGNSDDQEKLDNNESQ